MSLQNSGVEEQEPHGSSMCSSRGVPERRKEQWNEFELIDSLTFLPWCSGVAAPRQDFCGVRSPTPVV